jgi:DNA-binding response OmpR family regulator
MDDQNTQPKKKIMWMEDDFFLKRLIAQRLIQEQYELLQTNEGEATIALAKKERPNIIMLDILLAGTDGVEVLRRLKSDEETKNIPVIMFSNVNDPERIKVSAELGAAAFFVKTTVTLDEILSVIKKFIG